MFWLDWPFAAATGFSTEMADERPIELLGRSVRFPPRPGGGRASERGKRILELNARTGVPGMGVHQLHPVSIAHVCQACPGGGV